MFWQGFSMLFPKSYILKKIAFSDGFSMNFGWFREGFGNVLAMFFHAFSKKYYSLKNNVFPPEN